MHCPFHFTGAAAPSDAAPCLLRPPSVAAQAIREPDVEKDSVLLATSYSGLVYSRGKTTETFRCVSEVPTPGLFIETCFGAET